MTSAGALGRLVVVDASLAVKWVLNEAGSDAALALLEEWVRAGVEMVAPPLLSYEGANVLHQRVRRGTLAPADALALWDDFQTIPLSYQTNPGDLIGAAIALAHRLGWPAAYDAAYLALADAREAVLWTADRKLGEHVAASGHRSGSVEVLAYE